MQRLTGTALSFRFFSLGRRFSGIFHYFSALFAEAFLDSVAVLDAC
jgi:hypothetical protein